MDDYISRQAAIDALDGEITVTGRANAEAVRGYANLVADRLKRLPSAQPEQRWIPCSERLPEEDGDYFVTFEEGYAEDYGLDLVGIAPYEVDCEGFGIWQEEFDPHTLGSLGSEWVDINVIAWQPLPEKFKEEGGKE